MIKEVRNKDTGLRIQVLFRPMSEYVSIRHLCQTRSFKTLTRYLCLRQHTSAHVSIRHLCQTHSFKTPLRHVLFRISRLNKAEIKVHQCSCKPPRMWSCDSTAAQFECADAARAVIAMSCLKTNCNLHFSFSQLTVNLLFNRTTTDMCILSTTPLITSLILFEVLLIMIVL